MIDSDGAVLDGFDVEILPPGGPPGTAFLGRSPRRHKRGKRLESQSSPYRPPPDGSPCQNVSPMKIPVRRLDSGLPLPVQAHPGDGGVDLFAREEVWLAPRARASVPTGIALAIPPGFAGLVLPRSGLAARHGLGVVNGPGLIDSGYRGEVRVLLVNHGQEAVRLARGERIAQLLVVPVADQELVEVEELPDSPRGEGGFGSTGR
jgi:dUTP pyrophosphatase